MNVVSFVREPDVEDERVKDVYRDVKESLRVSFVDSMIQAYASNPRFLDYAWRRLRPSMLSAPFVEQARRIGALAEQGVQNWRVSDHAAALHSRNYTETDLLKLRETAALFHNVLPKLAIIAQALSVALTGEPIGGGGVLHPPAHEDRDRAPRDFRGLHVPIADERESPLRVRTAFEELQRMTGVGFVSTTHRAMGSFPDWLDVFLADARPLASDARRRELCTRLDRAARDAARQLPYPLLLQEGAFADMIPVNDVFCSLLPSLIVDAVVARRGLGPDPAQ